MTNILVVTHGCLAKEFVSIAEYITQSKKRVVPVCFELDLDPSIYLEKITDAISAMQTDQPTIILTDLFGGTPSNVAIPFIRKDKVEVITGLNMSMLIYLMTQPTNKSFEELCKGAKAAAQDSILIAGEFLE